MQRLCVNITCRLLLLCQLWLELEAMPQTLHLSKISNRTYDRRFLSDHRFRDPLSLPHLTKLLEKSRKALVPPFNQRPKNLLISAHKSENYNSDIIKDGLIHDMVKKNANTVYSTLIWEIENGVLKQTEITHFREFQSDKSYVLFQTLYDKKADDVLGNTFYWIGKYSSEFDAGIAAAQAVLLDSKANPVIQIQREVEGEESPSFKAVFERTNKIEVPTEENPETVDVNRKRMFVIAGEDDPYAVEVELSSRYIFGSDYKCVVFVSKKAYVACRKTASERHKRSARELATIMMERKYIYIKEMEIHKIDNLFSQLTNEEAEDLLELFAELDVIPPEIATQQIAENMETFTLKEIRKIFDETDILRDGREVFRVKSKRLYEEDFGVIEEEDVSAPRYSPFVLMDTNDCYLVDTRSNLGLIVWMGRNSSVKLRQECAKRAEIYLEKKRYSYNMPIIFADQRKVEIQMVGDVQTLIHHIHSLDEDLLSSDDEDEIDEFSKKMNDSETVPIDEAITVIWTVQDGQLNSSDHVALESDKAYIIFQNTVDEISKKIEPSNARIYYWIGKDSSDKDAADAASHAMALDFRVHQKPQIYREVEGHESDEFRSFFKNYYLIDLVAKQKVRSEKVDSIIKTDAKIKMERKKMFLIEGEDRRNFREVELSFVHILGNEKNCLVLISKKVYVVCGNFASESKQKGAKELAVIMSERRGMKIEDDIKVYRIDKLYSLDLPVEEEEDLREYFANFDKIPKEEAQQQIDNDPEEFSPEEVRRILDQTLKQNDGGEWFNVKVFRIYEDYIKAIQMLYLRIFMMIPLDSLNTEDCYLVDSQSNVGLFLWIGKESGVNLRKASAKQAELYLREQKYDYTTQITYIAEENVPSGIKSVQSMVNVLKPTIKAEEAGEAASPLRIDTSATSAPLSTEDVLSDDQTRQLELGGNSQYEFILKDLQDDIEKGSEKLVNALDFSQLTHLLEYGYKKSISVKDVLANLGLAVINPEVIFTQLDMIYKKTSDKRTKSRITKIKHKINKEFYGEEK